MTINKRKREGEEERERKSHGWFSSRACDKPFSIAIPSNSVCIRETKPFGRTRKRDLQRVRDAGVHSAAGAARNAFLFLLLSLLLLLYLPKNVKIAFPRVTSSISTFMSFLTPLNSLEPM